MFSLCPVCFLLQSKDVQEVGDSKLAVEVNLSVSPCVGPVTDWQPV